MHVVGSYTYWETNISVTLLYLFRYVWGWNIKHKHAYMCWDSSVSKNMAIRTWQESCSWQTNCNHPVTSDVQEFCPRNKELATEVTKPAFLPSSFLVTVWLYFDMLRFPTFFCFIFAKNLTPNNKIALRCLTSGVRIFTIFAVVHLETTFPT